MSEIKVSVTFRHLPPTEALKQYAEQKIHRIGKYFSHPLEAHVILALDGKERKVAEVELRTRRATIVGKEQHQDLYAAIDLMVDKIERQIKITDFLNADTIVPALASRDKNAALEEMAGYLASSHRLDKHKVLSVLRERERISTTAIGEGVAIPHGKLGGVERVVGVFARSPRGIDFASLDGAPTYLFFVLIAPENAAADHLKALARISRLLKDEEFRRRLMQGQSRQELYTTILEEDEKF
jgi:nitrogen PTS system EIIA component